MFCSLIDLWCFRNEIFMIQFIAPKYLSFVSLTKRKISKDKKNYNIVLYNIMIFK